MIFKDFTKIKTPYCFLQTLSPDKENKKSFLFADFKKIITFSKKDNLNAFFREAENLLSKGFWLCGYFSYEFGYFLEPALHHLIKNPKEPLVWLGVCRQPMDIKEKESFSRASQEADYTIKNTKPNISREEYNAKIKRIKYYLKEGLTYQVNYTFKVNFNFGGDAFSFYKDLTRAQPTAYAAFIDTKDEKIISVSPELFFRIEKDTMWSRPMKGTTARGQNFKEDLKAKEFLDKDLKTRAENVMIVDLLRNDLGRVAKKVWVPDLFSVEKHRTLYQMTSTVKSQLKKDIGLRDIFLSLFPCGSVTGAPKIKTMEIIEEIEKEKRNVYTGAIGYISPKREACFSVAIRTIYLRNKKGELGIGGGIVYDSKPNAEYNEAILKAKFFLKKFPKIKLIESIRLKNEKYWLLDLHLKRLKASAEYFSIPINISKIKTALRKKTPKGFLKVRVVVDMEGEFNIERAPIEKIKKPVKVKISKRKTNSKNSFLYHKTTERGFYDKERTKSESQGFFDILFTNNKGELTEGSISNIFVLKNKKLYTPKLECGLLGGVLRESLLGSKKAKEKILYPKDLKEAAKIYIGNSVRGLLEAKVF